MTRGAMGTTTSAVPRARSGYKQRPRTGPHHKQRVIPVDLLEAERHLYRKSFRDFIPHAFEVLEGGDARFASVRKGLTPPKFSHGWHIDALAEHLQAVAHGQISRLLINISPGTMKSVECSVLWPVWMWATIDPALRFIFSSYSEDFTKRDNRRSKVLINTDWFQERFPHVKVAQTPETQLEYHNTAGGERHGASTNSGVTGKHVHGIVEDDPLKLQDARSKRARDDAWTYHSEALGSRLLPEGGWRVVVMQRLHEDDISGRILERAGDDADSYVHLRLPMEFESKFRCKTSLPFVDPRTEEGELMWPARLTPAYVRALKSPNGLGSYGFAAQYQQRPTPAEGGIVKRDWWRRWTVLPEKLTNHLISVDCTFKKAGSSFVVFQAWARDGASAYLLDQYRDKADFAETVRKLVVFCARWPQAALKLIEDKANGPAVISTLKSSIPGLVADEPKGSKEERLAAVSPFIEAGNVYIPAVATWVDGYIEELCIFPNGANDDQCDATSQALLRLLGNLKATSVPLLQFSVAGERENPWAV